MGRFKHAEMQNYVKIKLIFISCITLERERDIYVYIGLGSTRSNCIKCKCTHQAISAQNQPPDINSMRILKVSRK